MDHAKAPQASAGAPAQGLYRHYVLTLLALVYGVSLIDRFVVSIVTEDLKAAFQVSDGWIGVLSGLGFALVYATLGIPIAYLADRGNRRNIVAGSLALFSAATIACGMAGNFAHLLLARLAVGVGEAGTSPPSHSMVSDLYGPKARPAAMSIFSVASNIGILSAFMVGGWVTAAYGWRTTFLVAGVPGLVLTLLIVLTVREPVRGAQDQGVHAAAEAPSPSDVVGFLARRASFLHLCMASALLSFVSYGAMQWSAPFLIRAHALDLVLVGTIVGLVTGVTGMAGGLLGGFVSSYFGARDARYYMLLPMAALLIGLPFLLGFYLLANPALAIACYIIPILSMAFFLPAALATSQSLVPPQMRATTSAIFFFIMNIIGLMLGPTAVGVFSDLYRPLIDVSALAPEAAPAYADAQGLRWALVTCAFVMLWAALHFYLGSRTLKSDLARANQA